MSPTKRVFKIIFSHARELFSHRREVNIFYSTVFHGGEKHPISFQIVSPCSSAWQQLKPCKPINLLVISSQFDYLTIAHHSNAQVKISIGWGLSCLKWLVHVLSTRQPLSFYCSKQILLYIFYYYLLCIKVYFGKLNFYPIHLKDEGILICILSYTLQIDISASK